MRTRFTEISSLLSTVLLVDQLNRQMCARFASPSWLDRLLQLANGVQIIVVAPSSSSSSASTAHSTSGAMRCLIAHLAATHAYILRSAGDLQHQNVTPQFVRTAGAPILNTLRCDTLFVLLDAADGGASQQFDQLFTATEHSESRLANTNRFGALQRLVVLDSSPPNRASAVLQRIDGYRWFVRAHAVQLFWWHLRPTATADAAAVLYTSGAPTRRLAAAHIGSVLRPNDRHPYVDDRTDYERSNRLPLRITIYQCVPYVICAAAGDDAGAAAAERAGFEYLLVDSLRRHFAVRIADSGERPETNWCFASLDALHANRSDLALCGLRGSLELFERFDVSTPVARESCWCGGRGWPARPATRSARCDRPCGRRRRPRSSPSSHCCGQSIDGGRVHPVERTPSAEPCSKRSA